MAAVVGRQCDVTSCELVRQSVWRGKALWILWEAVRDEWD